MSLEISYLSFRKLIFRKPEVLYRDIGPSPALFILCDLSICTQGQMSQNAKKPSHCKPQDLILRNWIEISAYMQVWNDPLDKLYILSPSLHQSDRLFKNHENLIDSRNQFCDHDKIVWPWPGQLILRCTVVVACIYDFRFRSFVLHYNSIVHCPQNEL